MKDNSDIIFSRDINISLDLVLNDIDYSNLFILMDVNTKNDCWNLLSENVLLKNAYKIVIETGENIKNIATTCFIWDELNHNQANRNTLLINLGGGVVSDIGGFAASCFKRGIKHINIPTTLLSQVDASVGGKTGVNLDSFKNEIGTFKIPERVIIYPLFLKTLSHKNILSGYGEMLKHALISDKKYLEELFQLDLKNIDYDKLGDLIKTSVEIKNDFVEKDPLEKNIRKVLNFGHTIGHAIETYAIENKIDIYHGEAVALGIISELFISVKRVGFKEEDYRDIKERILALYPNFDVLKNIDEMTKIMGHDKKNVDESINFTLLSYVGKYRIDNYLTPKEVKMLLISI